MHKHRVHSTPPVRKVAFLAACVLSLASRAAPGADTGAPRLADLDLEDLMKVEITSVSKRPQRLSEAPAAVSVLTADDLRRLGVTSIPDALRTIPGVEVARIDGTKYAVSVRGFNGGFSTKLLVLVDGRSVYSPLFSGVFWDQVDTMLEDVERIEVIRGPGAALWGSNAVNGVINIITKSAADTQGTLVSLAAGPDERRAGARIGATTEGGTRWRLYALNTDRDETSQTGSDRNGGVLRQTRAGFRAEQAVGDRDHLILQGEVHGGNSGGAPSPLPSVSPVQSVGIPTDSYAAGAHAKGRWLRELGGGDTFTADLYFDRNQRRRLVGEQDTTDTWDLALQHTFASGKRHKVVWGGGLRNMRYDITNAYQISVARPTGSEQLANVFAQDEIALVPERLRLTLGVKLERSSLVSGANPQPDARLLWNLDATQVLWTAVSRANRLPSLVEKTATVHSTFVPPVAPSPFPVIAGVLGNDAVKPERLTSWQVGYRNAVSSTLAFDVTAYLHRYRDLILATSGPDCNLAGGPSYISCLTRFDNASRGTARGFEATVDWRPVATLRLQASYTYLDVDLSNDVRRPTNTALQGPMDRSPRQQASLHASQDLTERLQLDVVARHVDALRGGSALDGYTTADARLSWRPRQDLELALTGRNLFEPRHLEFVDDPFFKVAEVRRTFLASMIWKF